MLFEPCLRADFKDFVIFLSFYWDFKRQVSVLSLWLVEKTKSSRAKPAISKEKYIFDKKTCKKFCLFLDIEGKLVKSQRLIYHGFPKGVVILGRRQSRFGKRFDYFSDLDIKSSVILPKRVKILTFSSLKNLNTSRFVLRRFNLISRTRGLESNSSV